MHKDPISHARNFADFLETKISEIADVLLKYESKNVVDDEVNRSLDVLRNMHEIGKYFETTPLSKQTVTFLPLNLPLYSFILFAAMPAYQSAKLIIRAPHRMQEVFAELFEVLSVSKYYPNITVFEGSRADFLNIYCKESSVVIFTGKHENLLRVRKVCRNDALILFNGVGHTPLVITPSSDIELAVEKSLHVKLFNNGQDCAGPDVILVHSLVIDKYMEVLLRKLQNVKCGNSYFNQDVIVGSLFEPSSLLDTAKLISTMQEKGATIEYGGQFDLKEKIMYPCVVKTTLREMQNFSELYSPLFVVTEYDHDGELSLYFNSVGSQYQESEMYISLFGESKYVTNIPSSIVLKDCTIHDIERGTEEYGGYSQGASSVSYRGITIAKPLLIPREISNFLSLRGQEMFVSIHSSRGNKEKQIVEYEFKKAVTRIFGEELVFAYIFGSFALGRDKRFSDIDTMICVNNRRKEQIEEYLEWVFNIHEMFGRIPDLKYPSEIVTLDKLKAKVSEFEKLNLSAVSNKSATYDAMIWFHSLSQPWAGEVNTENIPDQWKQLFRAHSSRLLRSFLTSLEESISDKKSVSFLGSLSSEIPRGEPEISNFIHNLSDRKLLAILKLIPFDEEPLYSNIVLRLVMNREFMGRSIFSAENTDELYHPDFRFGVVNPKRGK